MFKHRAAVTALVFALLLAACAQPPTQSPVQNNTRTFTPLSLQLYIGDQRGDNIPVPSAEQTPQAVSVVRTQGFPVTGDLSFSQATYTMRVITDPERWYFTAAFRVTNNTDAPLQNLTMVARSRVGQSIGGTSISKIQGQNGSVLNDPGVARGLEPINTVRTFDGAVTESASDLQAFQAAETAQLETAAVNAGALPGADALLNYGFVVRKSNTSRTIPPRTCKTSAQDQCNVGTVSVTFKTPAFTLSSGFPSLPLKLTFESLLVTDSNNRVTRSEESTTNAVLRAQNLGASQVALVGSDTDTAGGNLATVRIPGLALWRDESRAKAVLDAFNPVGPVTTKFNFDASRSGGRNANFAWSFGDGATASGVSATHDYNAPGLYTVNLTVTDDQNGTSTATTTVSVLPNLQNLAAGVNLRAGLKGTDTINFDLGDPLPGFGYEWSFGDGTTGNGSRVTKTYPTLGTYVVKVKVVDNRPATTQRAGQIRPQALGDTVFEDETWITRWEPAPKARFKLTTAGGEGVPFGIAPLPTSFDATTSSGSSALTYAWTFGTSGTATGAQVNYTFPEGEHIVTLTVTDAKGQKDTYRAYVVAKNENMYSRIAFDYPTITTASARFLEESLSEGRTSAPRGGSAPARVRAQAVDDYTDYFPYVMHKSAVGRTATTRWNAFSNGGNYRNVFCNQVNVFYNQVALPSFFLAQNTAFPEFCEFASIRRNEFPSLQARGNSEYFITSSLWNQAFQFDTFSGLRVPRVVMAVLPDSAIPGDKPSPFVSENTASVNGLSELLLTVRFRESEIVNGFAEFKVPVYAVNDAGNLVTTANGYFRGSFVSSSTNVTTSCEECVMVNGKAFVKVRVFVPAFKITGEKIDLSTLKLFANPSCGSDNSPWVGKVRDFAQVFGCTTVTTSSAVPSGTEPIEPFAYPISSVTASFFGHVVAGDTAEAVTKFYAYLQEGFWNDTRDFVLGFVPFVGSGSELLGAIKSCRPQCNAVVLVLAGAGVAADAIPVIGDALVPYIRSVRNSLQPSAKKGISDAIGKVVNDGLDATRNYDGIRNDLNGAFGDTIRALDTCGLTCREQVEATVDVYRIEASLTPKDALKKVDVELKDTQYTNLNLDYGARIADLESSVYCVIKSGLGTQNFGRIQPLARPAPKNLCPTTVTKNAAGLVTQVSAQLDPQYINGGTYPTSASRKYTTTYGSGNDDAGHIIAFVLGGAGGLRSGNIVPILSSLNQGSIARLEQRLAQLVRTPGNTVVLSVNLKYTNAAYPKRPSELIYTWTVNGVPSTATFTQ